jgi:hypothetical protein
LPATTKPTELSKTIVDEWPRRCTGTDEESVTDGIPTGYVAIHSLDPEGAVTTTDVAQRWRARAGLERSLAENKRLKDHLHDENLALRERIDPAFREKES